MATARYYDVLTAEPTTPSPETWHVDNGSAAAYLVGPAFFDAQVNGFAGVDFQDPNVTAEGVEHAARALQRAGCSHFLITLITADADFLEQQCRQINEHIAGSALLRETIPGLHLEGPFLNGADGYLGAHPREHVRPADWGLFERWQRASGGRIAMMTVAPECLGCLEFITKAAAAGVFVSLGHTDADRHTLLAAQAAGARIFTHLGNACPQLMHRYDNIIQRVLSIPDLLVSLIPDGLHVPPMALGNVVRMLGPGRIVMITDAASPAGAPAGTYRMGHLELTVGPDRIVRFPGGDNYAGSALTPVEGFYNTVRFGGLSADAAWYAWTRLRNTLFPGLKAPQLALPFGV
jgi:N-acetylglucosamine-6-phosphate deacetylase